MRRHITEDRETQQVTVGDETLTGWIDDVECDLRGALRIYHDDHDAPLG